MTNSWYGNKSFLSIPVHVADITNHSWYFFPDKCRCDFRNLRGFFCSYSFKPWFFQHIHLNTCFIVRTSSVSLPPQVTTLAERSWVQGKRGSTLTCERGPHCIVQSILRPGLQLVHSFITGEISIRPGTGLTCVHLCVIST